MSNKTKIFVMSFIVLLFCTPFLSAEVAVCPNLATYKIWASLVNLSTDSTLGGDTVVKERITEQKKQGYFTSKCSIESKYSPRDGHRLNIGTCTRKNFDALPDSPGVLYIEGHGMPGSMNVLCVSDRSVAEQWMNDGYGSEHLFIDRDTDPTGKYGTYYRVSAYSDYFKTHMKRTLDSNKTIVIVYACSSAKGLPPYMDSVLDAIGGRVAFGWSDKFDNRDDGKPNLQTLFDHMNGSKPDQSPGTKRKAGDAFAATNADGNAKLFRMVGNGNTTLCPSVENPTESNVSPIGSGTGLSGRGFIIFDTELNTEIAADKALTFSVTRGVTIHSVSWVGSNKINFGYHFDDCTPDYTVTVTAVAGKILGNKFGMQQLDGGDIAGDGVAPNEHDFVWTFSK